ncbi:MAG: DUF2306 domain-containing protein [Steroidobacteraceae bacterium]
MTEAVLARGFELEPASRAVLDASARLWWVVTALGQWIFAFYVAAFFGTRLARDGLEGLKDSHLFNGYIPGDDIGNAAVAAHVVLAIVIMSVGPLQMLPQIRGRFPILHHWMGRSYILAAVTASVAGLYLIWSRPIFGPLSNNIATSLDGVLIVSFAAIALRHAIARDIATHRRWALRLFMVASSVWFLRIGFRLWDFLTGGVGIDEKSFSGPFVVTWHFGQFLLPLAILELYFRARDSEDPRARAAMAGGLFMISILMGIGAFLVATNSWLARL